MRVLHVMPYDGPGGYCRVIYDLCTRSQCDARVAVFGPGAWATRLRRAGVDVVDLVRIMAAPTAARRVAGLDRMIRGVDLVNVHVGPALEAPVRAIAESLSVPAVYTLHWPLRLPVRRTSIIGTSREVAALQDPSNRCFTIENGVDLVRFRPPPRPRTGGPVIVRLCRPERCARYFWDAIEPVLRRHPRARLWILGEAGASTRQVRFWGYRDDVPALLRRASILAYTPRPGEGTFDLSILEAMASGVVPVVTDVESTRGAITDGTTGVLVPYGDVLAFEAALERAVREPRRIARLARAARRTTSRHHDLDATVAAHDRAYAAILTPRRSGTARARRR